MAGQGSTERTVWMLRYTICCSIVFAVHMCVRVLHCWRFQKLLPTRCGDAAAGSEVQGKLGGHAEGCSAPLCLFKGIKTPAGLLFSTCLTAFDECTCFPVRPGAPRAQT